VRPKPLYCPLFHICDWTSGEGRTHVVDSAQMSNGMDCATSGLARGKVKNSIAYARMFILLRQSGYNPLNLFLCEAARSITRQDALLPFLDLLDDRSPDQSAIHNQCDKFL
jgi:hypothetical protein